jgi:Tfp pilus assembly protein PilE
MMQRKSRAGTTLLEVAVVTTIIGVLVSMSVPSFQRAVEQSRADMAAANLRSIWSAERVYWLENRAYATDLSVLQSAGLIDPAIAASSTFYVYQVGSNDANSFTATAIRALNARWNGSFTIDDTGQTSGSLSSAGDSNIVPSFQ